MMNLSARLLATIALFGVIFISLVTSYPEEDFFDEDLHFDSLRGTGSDMTEDFYSDNNRVMTKRMYPRWHHAFVFKEPSTYRSSAIAETKRFRPPFHPLVRFRGLSLHGGRIPSAYKPREDFESFISSLPNPSHPSISGPKVREEEPNSGDNSDQQDDKMNAGDILRYLSSISNPRDVNGRARLFRFGIK